MGILDSKKDLNAMQEEIKQLRADVDRLKGLVLEIAKQVPAPTDPPQQEPFHGPTTFVYRTGDFSKFMKK